VLQTRTWSGATSITLLQHTSMQHNAYIQLTEAAENIPAEVPGPRQRVTYLLDSLKTIEPKVLAGIAAIEQDELGKQINFEQSVTFLLPLCPMVDKNAKAKGLGAKFSSSEGKVVKGSGTVTKGKTGVELCWHESSKYRKIIKEQKDELAEWNKNNPKKNGTSTKKCKAGETNVRQTKARNELLTAMVKSQMAGLTAMSVKIALLTVGSPTDAVHSVGGTVSFNPQAMKESHKVLAEQARVALVQLQ